MAANPTPNPTDETTPAAISGQDLIDQDAPAVAHDRAVTSVGSGRITFKGHNAKSGYPFRIYEGQVQALVDGAWVEAPDSQALEG